MSLVLRLISLTCKCLTDQIPKSDLHKGGREWMEVLGWTEMAFLYATDYACSSSYVLTFYQTTILCKMVQMLVLARLATAVRSSPT